LNLAFSTGNNQITTTGFTYDASGNLTKDLTSSYTWNAESEITAAAGVNYTYDGDGDRVQKSNGKIYWYGAGTEILDESDANGNITAEYVFFGGKRVALRTVASGAITYYAEDFLGTSRVMLTSSGAVCYDADFYPFGGERAYTNSCSQNYKFEGKERDTETNNDDFGARYYSSVYGRWLSPDWSSVPAPVPYANLTNPQTLNLYAMVSDNPETFADLDGHQEPDPEEDKEEDAREDAELEEALGRMSAPNSGGSSTRQYTATGYDDPLTGMCYAPGTGGPSMSSSKPTQTRTTDFVVTTNGEAIPVPDNASGPTPTKGSGMQYQGGSGGKGMDDQTTGVRIMDPNANQGGRVSYNNASGQKVDPATGKTISNSDPKAHMPLKPQAPSQPPAQPPPQPPPQTQPKPPTKPSGSS